MTRKMNVFLDSGAYSAFTKNAKIDIQDYINFIKEHLTLLDHYANLDVIYNAEATFFNQQIMEQAGLNPMPCYHAGEDFKYLHLYLKNYDYIALGGLTTTNTSILVDSLDDCWEIICDTPDRLPKCKIHGFGMTSSEVMFRYPWYSVDSASWAFTGAFGNIMIPAKDLKGNPVYSEPAVRIKISDRAPQSTEEAIHFKTLSPAEQKYVVNHLTSKGYELGTSTYKGVDKKYKLQENERWIIKNKEVEVREELGVINDHNMRDRWNIQYFVELEQHFRPWPWAFKPNKLQGFGL